MITKGLKHLAGTDLSELYDDLAVFKPRNHVEHQIVPVLKPTIEDPAV